MAIIISPRVREKLLYKIPPVRVYEIEECFDNRTTRTILDKRRRHRTMPTTRWFIAETMTGRRLKIVFIPSLQGDQIVKTAYEPNLIEEGIYAKKAKTELL